MNDTAQISERSSSQSPPAGPEIYYWEAMWNRLHQAGWKLGHTTLTDPDTGAVRHLICARRGSVILQRSARTVTEAFGALQRDVFQREQ